MEDSKKTTPLINIKPIKPINKISTGIVGIKPINKISTPIINIKSVEQIKKAISNVKVVKPVASVVANNETSKVEVKSTPVEITETFATAPQQTTQTNQPIEPAKQPLISNTKLMEANVHIGLQTKRWNPAMRAYIKGRKGQNHLFDLNQMQKQIEKAYQAILEATQKNGKVLYVETKVSSIKTQIREQIRRIQGQGNYVIQRWLGGTLTNFKMISNSIRRLNDLVVMDKNGDFQKYTKKEQIELHKEVEKLIKFVGGIRTMRVMPAIIIIVDPKIEYNAVAEAKKMGITTIGLVNSNGNPNDVDIAIPMNTISIRSVTLILQLLTDAICEVKNLPVLVARKPDSQIVLMEEIKFVRPTFSKVNHRSFYNHSSHSTITPTPTTVAQEAPKSTEQPKTEPANIDTTKNN